ncbi:c-type cytochrome [Henriciella sp.]|uniref:c-type cytochrome n=1 Tax=Henriciella sp. TaxID=1968823 RepID=UPI0034216A4C
MAACLPPDHRSSRRHSPGGRAARKYRPPRSSLLKSYQKTYPDRSCAQCHTPSGAGARTHPPSRAGRSSRLRRGAHSRTGHPIRRIRFQWSSILRPHSRRY